MKETIKMIDLGYIRLDGWESTEGLIQPWMKERGEEEPDHNEIVLPGSADFVLKITYPLSKAAIFPSRTPSTGVSRIDLVDAIVKAYKQVYDEEDKTSPVKAGHMNGMFNRNETVGKHGIWGHDLGDLILHTAYVDEDGVITLGVDS